MKKILFICTGNTCRSPMAEGLFRELLKKNGIDDITCGSAGVSAMPGDEAAANAILAAAELGADISTHRARRFSPYMAEDTDLFVCMSQNHARMLGDIPGEKIYILAGGIPDPFGGDMEEYRLCARLIAEGLEELLKSLRLL